MVLGPLRAIPAGLVVIMLMGGHDGSSVVWYSLVSMTRMSNSSVLDQQPGK